MSFELDLQKFQKTLKERKKKFIRKVTMQAHKEITERTPVKTGRAKANWWVSEGNPDTKTDNNTQFDPYRAISLKVSGEKNIFIANSLPYINALENGSSRQAPAGMVMITRDKLQMLIDSGAIKPEDTND